MIAWYALTRAQPIADAVVCAALIGHPQVLPSRQARLRAPIVRRLAKIAPHRTLPISKLADFDHIALGPELLHFFSERDDDVWCWRYTLSSLASLLEFRPQRDWPAVEIPTLVVAGGTDRMTPEAAIRTVMAHAQPPGAELQVIPAPGTCSSTSTSRRRCGCSNRGSDNTSPRRANDETNLPSTSPDPERQRAFDGER